MEPGEAISPEKPYPQEGTRFAGVREREPRALEQFFDQYFGSIYGFCSRMLGDRDLAEDATQEVLFKVWRFADRLDVSRDPMPWLLTIALRQCQNHRRSRNHRDRASMASTEDFAEDLVSRDDGPPKNLVIEETHTRVQQALLKLSADARAFIVLHDFQHLNHEEIGKISGLSHAAVRKRYSRAVLQLSKILTSGANEGGAR